MEYDIRVRIQGMPSGADELAPLVLETDGKLMVTQGEYALTYHHYSGDGEAVKTSIQLNRDTVSMVRSDHTAMLFSRKTPSFHPQMTPSGQVISVAVFPHRVEWNQRKGKGSLRLSYDLVYDGRIASNHDMLFEFYPVHGTL